MLARQARWCALALCLGLACRKQDTKPRDQPAGPAGQRTQTRPVRAVPGPEVIGAIGHMPPEEGRAFHITEQFGPVPKPGPDDWLAFHPEDPQSVADYSGSLPNMPYAPRDTIVIVALSELDPDKGPALEELVEYAHQFFGLQVRVLDGVTTEDLKPRRRVNAGFHQINAADVLDALEERIPEDAYCVIALTTEDLYPSEEFNYVFGLARLKRRVGVFSFARYATPSRTLAVRRALKVLTHEVGHMFGITHCTHFSCNMNGSNHLEELDREPMHLCPVCLRKLHMAVAFTPLDRYRRLHAIYEEAGLTPEAAWTSERIDYLLAPQ